MTNAANAISRRFTLSLAYSARDFGGKTHAAKSWCTGKDSNLRTSLGGTDLQSVGFNHSPTCAETAQAPAPIQKRSVPTALYGVAQTRNGLARCATLKTGSGAHTLAHEKSLHFGKIPNGVRLENRAAKLLPPPCRIIVPGAGEGI